MHSTRMLLATVAGAVVLVAMPMGAAVRVASRPSPNVLSIKVRDRGEAIEMAREDVAAGHCVRIDPVDGATWLHSC